MGQCTDKSKLIRILEMIGKEAELGQGRLPSEETDACTNVQWMKTQRTFYQLRVWTWIEGSQL